MCWIASPRSVKSPARILKPPGSIGARTDAAAAGCATDSVTAESSRASSAPTTPPSLRFVADMIIFMEADATSAHTGDLGPRAAVDRENRAGPRSAATAAAGSRDRDVRDVRGDRLERSRGRLHGGLLRPATARAQPR